VLEASVGDRAASVRPDRPGRVGLVDDQPDPVVGGELEEFLDRADVTVHREQRLGHDQRAAALGLLDAPVQVLDVAVGGRRTPRRERAGGRP
jgi:hypothetical protein